MVHRQTQHENVENELAALGAFLARLQGIGAYSRTKLDPSSASFEPIAPLTLYHNPASQLLPGADTQPSLPTQEETRLTGKMTSEEDTVETEATEMSETEGEMSDLPKVAATSDPKKTSTKRGTKRPEKRGKTCKLLAALLDSGAMVCSIREKLATDMGYVPGPVDQDVLSASGHGLRISGMIAAKFKIGSVMVEHPVYLVPDLQYDFILGNDVIKQHLTIDSKNQWFKTHQSSTKEAKNNWIPLGRENICPTTSIRLPQNTMLLAGHGYTHWVPATDMVSTATYHFSPSQRFTGDLATIQVMAALVQPKHGHVPVIVHNEGHKPVTLWKDTVLGEAMWSQDETEVLEVLDLPPTSKSTISQLKTRMEGQCSGEHSKYLSADTIETLKKQLPLALQGVDLEGADTTFEQKNQLVNLLSEFEDVIATKQNSLGLIPRVYHHIPTGNHAPVQSRPYRTPFCYCPEIECQIRQLVELGAIWPSSSPYSSPIVVIPKKGGKELQICVDYCALNRCTKPGMYPLPCIDELMSKMGCSQYFSTLDLKNGYHHVQVHPDDVEKTAFICFAGLFEWL